MRFPRMRNLAPKNSRFLSPMKQVREWYKTVSWSSRLLGAGLITALLGVILWQYNVTTPIIGVGIIVGLLALTHIVLTWTYWLKIAFVWILNIASIPWAASLYGSLTPSANASWMFVESVTVSLLASALFTFLAVRHARGRLWLTLALIFTAMNFGGAFLTGALTIHSGGAWVGIALGAAVFILRCAFPRPKGTSPLPLSEDDVKSLLLNLPEKGFAGIRAKQHDALVVTDRKARVSVIHTVNAQSPLTFSDTKGPVYDGYPLSSWLVSKTLESQEIARKVPVLSVIAVKGDRTLDRMKYMPVELARSDSQSRIGVVALVSAKHLPEGLNRALDDVRPKPATVAQVKELGAKLVG